MANTRNIINVECPICNSTFIYIQELENHLNTMAQVDERHRVFYTLYRSMNVHYSMRITRMFADYIKKIEFVEERLRSIRGRNLGSLRKLLDILHEGLYTIEPDCTDSISESIHKAAVLFIKDSLESPINSKRDAMQVVSKLKRIFKLSTSEAFHVLMKATLILCQKFTKI